MFKPRILNAHTISGVIAFMACFCASTAALADTTAATQMLPPTAAGSTANCGTANSILSFNPSPGVGSAINCTATTIDPSTGYFNAINSAGNIFSQNGVYGYGVYSYASYYDAPFLSIDHFGKQHQLIGTYDGWNGGFPGHTNPMFIAGYNANSPQLGYNTDIVAIGGFGSNTSTGVFDSPVATFDLTGHKVGIGNLNPQATLDITGSENVSGNETVGGNETISGALTTGSISTAGSVSALNFSATSATTPLTGNDINVLHALESEACTTPGQVLVGIGSSAHCMTVDTATIPTVPTVPNCPSGQVVTANGSSYSCVPQTAAAPTPPSCTGANQALHWNGSAYTCDTIATGTGASGSYYTFTSFGGSGADFYPMTVLGIGKFVPSSPDSSSGTFSGIISYYGLTTQGNVGGNYTCGSDPDCTDSYVTGAWAGPDSNAHVNVIVSGLPVGGAVSLY